MRKSMDRTGRCVVCASASLAWSATSSSAVAAVSGESARIPDTRPVRDGRHRTHPVRNSAIPATGMRNSTGPDFGRMAVRWPAYRNTRGFDSGVFGVAPAPRSGGDRPVFRRATRKPGYPLGALFGRTGTGR
ncbi:hypothetical protein ACWCV5_24695 [Streptomyces tubercidicus]